MKITIDDEKYEKTTYSNLSPKIFFKVKEFILEEKEKNREKRKTKEIITS